MKIRELNKGEYIIVYDLGKSEYSEGMTVVGRVIELEFDDDDKNKAVIDSVGSLYTVTDENYFDNWQDHMKSITESVSDKWISNAMESEQEKLRNTIRKSVDLQQRKRKEENTALFKIKDLKVGYKVQILKDDMIGEVCEIADNGKSAEIRVDDGVYRVINDNYDFTIIEWNAVPEYAEDTVNHPSHYNYGEIEVIDFIEQVAQHYNPKVAYHIGNAIKYLARSPHKNGKEDIAKAKWYIERAFENWDK